MHIERDFEVIELRFALRKNAADARKGSVTALVQGAGNKKAFFGALQKSIKSASKASKC